MSNENEKNELVPGLNVTKPELEMLRNEPEAFERYTKFCEMKLKAQHEFELEKVKAQNEHDLEKLKVQNEHELEKDKARNEHELEKDKAQNEHDLEKVKVQNEKDKVQNEQDLEKLKVEMEEREKIRTYINDICEYVVDVGVNYFASLKSDKPIPEDVAKSIDTSNLDLG